MPTQRQQEVLDYVTEFISVNKYPPTKKEIADHFGFAVNAAVSHLNLLEKKGCIEIIPTISRGIVIKEKTA